MTHVRPRASVSTRIRQESRPTARLRERERERVSSGSFHGDGRSMHADGCKVENGNLDEVSLEDIGAATYDAEGNYV